MAVLTKDFTIKGPTQYKNIGQKFKISSHRWFVSAILSFPSIKSLNLRQLCVITVKMAVVKCCNSSIQKNALDTKIPGPFVIVL